MQEYKIDKKFFSVDDLSALLMGLSSLSGMVRGDEVAHVLAKVKSFIPAERAKDIALRVNQIKLGTVMRIILLIFLSWKTTTIMIFSSALGINVNVWDRRMSVKT